MNSCLSKSFKSSAFSPMPTSFAGRENSFAMAIIIPPFAEPSSFVIATDVRSSASLKTFACERPFCPRLASSTRILSLSAPGAFFSMTFLIFFNSSIRLNLFCSLPAVSIIMISKFSFFAFSIASKTTEALSALSLRTISTPALFDHMSSCSSAAARKVSPAASRTFLPESLNLFASFPIRVVLPAPLTPVTKYIFRAPSL